MLRSTHAALFCMLLGGWGCAEPESASDEPVPPPTAPAGLEPQALESVATEPVDVRAGPGDMPFEVVLRTPELGPTHARRIGTKTFQIALRSAELTQYPCTSCHTPGQVIISADRIADAHQNVQAVHPSDAGGQCGTCHLPDNVERLRLPGGQTATLDQAYRLCSQCHFSQVDAWAGGAHGKRLDGWQGRRVLMGCTDCHDPHQPVTPQRIPFPGPRLTSREAHQP